MREKSERRGQERKKLEEVTTQRRRKRWRGEVRMGREGGKGTGGECSERRRRGGEDVERRGQEGVERRGKEGRKEETRGRSKR